MIVIVGNARGLVLSALGLWGPLLAYFGMQIFGLDSWTWLLWLCPAAMGMTDLLGRLAGSGSLLERLFCPSQGGSSFFLPVWCLAKGVLPGSLCPALWKSQFSHSDAFVWVVFFLWAGLAALGFFFWTGGPSKGSQLGNVGHLHEDVCHECAEQAGVVH